MPLEKLVCIGSYKDKSNTIRDIYNAEFMTALHKAGYHISILSSNELPGIHENIYLNFI